MNKTGYWHFARDIKEFGDLITADVIYSQGDSMMSINGSEYVLTVMDLATRMKWPFPLGERTADAVHPALIKFLGEQVVSVNVF